jgi:hypothetical protein
VFDIGIDSGIDSGIEHTDVRTTYRIITVTVTEYEPSDSKHVEDITKLKY